MLDQPTAKDEWTASYRTMEEGTREEYHRVAEMMIPIKAGTADRVLASVAALKDSYPGEIVDRYVHSAQCATRAFRDGADEELVVGAFVHDIGDMLSPDNHAEFAAVILQPYVSPRTHWVIQQHGLFQGYYYFHHFDQDPNARDKFKGHPYYQDCVDFCHKWDQRAFDPDYDTMPLDAFRPMVHRVFAREPWGEHTKA